MLLQNPQLAYALLQAQVVMRIVNPETAIRMLHPKTNPTKPINPSVAAAPPPLPQRPPPIETRNFEQRPPPTSQYPPSYHGRFFVNLNFCF